MTKITKNDWKLYQERIGQWQERYMGKLLQEYSEQITDESIPASMRFWALEKAIKEDKKNIGVQCQIAKEDTFSQILSLVRNKQITRSDLTGFSDSLINSVLDNLVLDDRYLFPMAGKTPIIPEAGEEVFQNGIFLFAITRLLNDIENKVVVPVERTIDMRRFASFSADSADLDSENVEKADLLRPLIFLEMAPDSLNFFPDWNTDDFISRGYVLADGYHRIAKAKKYDISSLPVYLVSMEEHINYLCNHYQEYAEYWNQKLRDRIWDSL